MTAPLIQTIYSSRAIRPFSDADLLELLERARIFNAAHGLTGMLLHAGGRFIQVLEGAEPEVDALVARIEADTRHDFVRVQLRRAIPHRDFSEWQMAFRMLDAGSASRYPELVGFFDEEFSSDRFLPWGSPASYLLKAFRETA